MKKDYLWDKTGEDSEIEKLETALQAFRYQETAPPALPVKVLLFKKAPSRKIFPFAKLAAAACIAFVIIAFVVRRQVSNNKPEVRNDLAETVKPQIDAAVPDIFIAEKSVGSTVDNLIVKNDSTVEKIENPKQFSEQKINQIRKIIPATVRQKQSKMPNIKRSKPNVELTREEHYAYEQLMLALSITSSKLKLVRDKVENIEKPNVASDNER